MDAAGRSPPVAASPPIAAASSPSASSFSIINYFWPTKEIIGNVLVNATVGSGSHRNSVRLSTYEIAGQFRFIRSPLGDIIVFASTKRTCSLVRSRFFWRLN